MKVHVVCRDLEEDKILPRLAKSLAGTAGWSVSEYPDPSADINHFIIYIDYAERFPGWHKTLVSCYFSHYEKGNSLKERCWHQAAAESDIAIITADQYNTLAIPTYKARPPIGTIFEPASRRPFSSVPVIGTSGFASARKGPGLVERLISDYTVAISGKGWPGAVWYSWNQMPEFYHSLDVYVCTSLVEGIPMPPLEALACDIPIVIPQGVGMLDDLEGPGIYKYKAGDYSDLVKKLKKALSETGAEKFDVTLSAITYSPVNWALDHVDAFEDFFSSDDKDLPSWEENSGMYCVAFGKPSRRCAVRCIESFKKQSNLPVALASTEALGPEDIFIQRDDIDIGGRLAKLAAYEAAPDWHYVLYLDADTEVISDVSPFFQLLADGWEAVICKDMGKYHTARMMLRPDNHAEFEETMNVLGCEEVMQYNGGVFAFRRCANVERFFKLWNEEWQKYAGRDQGALLRALYRNPIRFLVLGNQWNASTRYPLPEEVIILHHNMEARRWGGLIYGRTDSEDAWKRVEDHVG